MSKNELKSIAFNLGHDYNILCDKLTEERTPEGRERWYRKRPYQSEDGPLQFLASVDFAMFSQLVNELSTVIISTSMINEIIHSLLDGTLIIDVIGIIQSYLICNNQNVINTMNLIDTVAVVGTTYYSLDETQLSKYLDIEGTHCGTSLMFAINKQIMRNNMLILILLKQHDSFTKVMLNGLSIQDILPVFYQKYNDINILCQVGYQIDSLFNECMIEIGKNYILSKWKKLKVI